MPIGGFEGGLEEAQQMQLNKQAMIMNNLAMQRAELQNFQLQRQVQLQQEVAREMGGGQQQGPMGSTPVSNANSTALASPGIFAPPGGNPPAEQSAPPQSPAAGIANGLIKMAGVYMRGGDPATATQLINAAQNVGYKEAQTQSAQSKVGLNNINRELKAASLVGQYLGNAQSPADWEAGLNQLAASGAIPSREMRLLANTPYSPQTVQRLHDASINAATQARLALAKSQQQATAAYREAEIRLRGAEIEMQRQREIDRKQEALRKIKTGIYSSPSSADVNNAMSALKSFYGNVELGNNAEGNKNLTALNDMAEQVAQQAKDAVRANPGLTMEQAMQRAAFKMYQSGEYRFNQGGFFGGGKGLARVQDGTSANRAMPLPMDSEGKVSASGLVNGKIYITARGPASWNSKT